MGGGELLVLMVINVARRRVGGWKRTVGTNGLLMLLGGE